MGHRLPRTARLLAATLPLGPLALATAGDPPSGAPAFHPPVRIEAGGAPVAAEDPGYACPAWHDLNGDGRADLVVGQFSGGKMAAHLRAPDGSFAPRTWIEAAGEVAQVPGVW